MYDDRSGDAYQSGEQWVSNRRVYLDGDGDAQFDAGEQSVITATDGRYAFTVAPARTACGRSCPPTGTPPARRARPTS